MFLISGDDFRAEGSFVSNLVEVEPNPVIRIRIRKIKDMTGNIVNQSDHDDVPSAENEVIIGLSGEVLNEQDETVFEAVEPVPGKLRFLLNLHKRGPNHMILSFIKYRSKQRTSSRKEEKEETTHKAPTRPEQLCKVWNYS